MPWRTEFVEPEVALEYKGVKVYHTYRHDDADDVLSDYWFTIDPTSDENQFDIRDLPTWEGQGVEGGFFSKPGKLEVVRALKRAIDIDHLKKRKEG